MPSTAAPSTAMPSAAAPRPLPMRLLHRAGAAFMDGLREAYLYASGSGDSRLRQIEALREMDPRMLRDMGVDVGELMRPSRKTGKNVPPGA
ncbi:hypothetical protein V8Z80_09510 [Orrella sp. JC864]|uniref:hypothetical protein n=1 Tax=Orrella sp. JC864 TaxID=3120298 RepID=UPI0030098665